MSIEQEITKLREAIDDLTVAVAGIAQVLPQQAATVTTTAAAPEKPAEATKADKPKAEPQPDLAPMEPEPAPDLGVEAVEPPADDEPVVTRDDCAKAITDAVQAGKRDAAVAALKAVGAAKLADVDPDQYGALYAELQAVLA